MRMLLALVAVTIGLAATAQESKVQLKDGPGKDKVQICISCHSLDYIQMNARFMNKAGWTASINKMINAFGAPIDKADVETIAVYLTQQYGVQP